MTTRQKHRMAGKHYNFHRKIPVELQVQDDGAFLNEFSSQPTPGQFVQSLILMLRVILMHLLMAAVVIQITTLSLQNTDWMLGNLKEHHMLNRCRIRQVWIKL